jgi:thiol-disulfide isomerase/thioredoxin/YHS domain-containing protein
MPFPRPADVLVSRTAWLGATLLVIVNLMGSATGGEPPVERTTGFRPSTSAGTSASASASVTVPDGKPEAGRWAEDVETARVTAAATGRPVVLHFFAEWCGPCQTMEKNVLDRPEVLAELGGDGVIAVRVDVDAHEDLAEQYGVGALPTDVFLKSDGTVLTRAVGPTDAAGYAGRLARVADHLPSEDAANLLECPKCEPGDPVELLEEWARRRGPGCIELGLRGYCPVSLVDDRLWEKGEAKFAWSVGGVTYRLKDANALAKFRAEPTRYAPQLSGYDPHLLSTTARAVPGRAAFAAFYDGHLYLHATEASRRAFIADPAGHRLPQRIYPSAADVAGAGGAAENGHETVGS